MQIIKINTKQVLKKTIYKKTILTMFIFGLIWTLTPIAMSAPSQRNNFLPRNEDKAVLTVADKIRIEARRAGMDEEIMLKIARLESKMKPEAMNVNKNMTVDRGIFQINHYWHPEVSNECSYDIDCNIKSAMQIAKKSGYEQWTTYKLIKN